MISVYTIRNLELRGDKARLLIYVKFQELHKASVCKPTRLSNAFM